MDESGQRPGLVDLRTQERKIPQDKRLGSEVEGRLKIGDGGETDAARAETGRGAELLCARGLDLMTGLTRMRFNKAFSAIFWLRCGGERGAFAQTEANLLVEGFRFSARRFFRRRAPHGRRFHARQRWAGFPGRAQYEPCGQILFVLQ